MQHTLKILGCKPCCDCDCDDNAPPPRTDNSICAPSNDPPRFYSFDLTFDPNAFLPDNPKGHWCATNTAPNVWSAVRKDGWVPGTDLTATLTGTRNLQIVSGFYLTWRLEFVAGGVLLAAYNSTPGFAGSFSTAQQGFVCNLGVALSLDIPPGSRPFQFFGWPATLAVSPTCCGVLPRPCPRPPAENPPFDDTLVVAVLQFWQSIRGAELIDATGLWCAARDDHPFIPGSGFPYVGARCIRCGGAPVGPMPPNLDPSISATISRIDFFGNVSGIAAAIRTADSAGRIRRGDYEAAISFYGQFGQLPDGNSPIVMGLASPGLGTAFLFPDFAVLYKNLCAPTFPGAVSNTAFPDGQPLTLVGTETCPTPFNQPIPLSKVTPEALVWQSDLIGVMVPIVDPNVPQFLFRGDMCFYSLVSDGGIFHQVSFNRANQCTLYRAPAGGGPAPAGVPLSLSLSRVAFGSNWPTTLTLQP